MKSSYRNTRISIRTRSVKGAAIALLASTTLTGTAHATTSYGYSTLHFQNFILSGIADANGQPLSGVVFNSSSVTSTDGANYPGFAPGGNSAGGNLFSGTDTAQAISGPGPFPAENTFTQALTASSGTRGDAQITGAIASGATSNLVSEGNLTTNGSAGSNAGTSTSINASFFGASTVSLSFSASATLMSSVGNLGDSSNSQASASFRIFDATAGTYVFITDNLTGSSSTDITPFGLNQNVASTNPGAPQTFASSLMNYSYSANLVATHNYQLTLADSTSVILTSFVAAPVPEPETYAMMLAGLSALGFLARRRKTRALSSSVM